MKTWEVTIRFHLTADNLTFNPENWDKALLFAVASKPTTTVEWTFTPLIPDRSKIDPEDQ